MTRARKALAVLLPIALALSGCLEIGAPKSVLDESTIGRVNARRTAAYEWPEPEAWSANGTQLLASQGSKSSFYERFLGGQHAYPNVAWDSEGRFLLGAFDGLYRTADHGATWNAIYHYPGSPLQEYFPNVWGSGYTGVAVDPVNGRIFAVSVPSSCFTVAYSDDQGATWTDSRTGSWPACGAPGENFFGYHCREYMFCPGPPRIFIVPLGPDTNPTLMDSDYGRAIIICQAYNHGLRTVESWSMGAIYTPGAISCWTSLDGGENFLRFGDARTWANTHESAFLGCAPWRLGRGDSYPDGTIAIPFWGFEDIWWGDRPFDPTFGLTPGFQEPPGLCVATSRDSGQTWDVRKLDVGDEVLPADSDPQLEIADDETTFVSFRAVPSDLDNAKIAEARYGSLRFVRSGDRLNTLEGPFRVSAPSLLRYWGNSMTVADNQSVAFAYVGSKTPYVQNEDHGDGDIVPIPDIWHMFLTISRDAKAEEPTFTTQQVTPNEDPLGIPYRGYVLNSIQIEHDRNGRVHIAFDDACDPRNGCTRDVRGRGPNAYDVQIALAVQDEGMSLRDRAAPLPRLGLAWPEPLQHGDAPASSTHNCDSNSERSSEC